MLEAASVPRFPNREGLLTTLGRGADVSYFLPRLLEALAENALIDEVPLADRMLHIPAEHWTSPRIAAVQAALRALLEAAVP